MPIDEGHASESAKFQDSLTDPAGRGPGKPEVEYDQEPATIIIIDRRALARDCLARSLRAAANRLEVGTFSTVDEWLAGAARHASASLVLLCIGGRKPQDEEVSRAITLLSQTPGAPPIIILSDVEDAGQILSALDSGVRGYIPTSVTLNVAIEAMHLVRAGGVYLPASSLLSLRSPRGNAPSFDQHNSTNIFTSRQRAVLKAVREGKANKLIAYELNMKESTVKVHVRNIMKKLRAKNRTEVAYKTSSLFADGPET